MFTWRKFHIVLFYIVVTYLHAINWDFASLRCTDSNSIVCWFVWIIVKWNTSKLPLCKFESIFSVFLKRYFCYCCITGIHYIYRIWFWIFPVFLFICNLLSAKFSFKILCNFLIRLKFISFYTAVVKKLFNIICSKLLCYFIHCICRPALLIIFDKYIKNTPAYNHGSCKYSWIYKKESSKLWHIFSFFLFIHHCHSLYFI